MTQLDLPEHPEPRAANGNQPLITNQNDFQLFRQRHVDQGQHTLKGGGSITFRSRELLNSDTIIGNFAFNNNMTSNCAGQPLGCRSQYTGFDVASFMLRPRDTKNRNLFDAGTYTEKRPEISTVQDDFRASRKLTLNLGMRWDVYPPWTEIQDRQSNFDVTTGQFVVASDSAVIGGTKVGRYLQKDLKRDIGPALRLPRRRRPLPEDTRPRRFGGAPDPLAGRHLVAQPGSPPRRTAYTCRPSAVQQPPLVRQRVLGSRSSLPNRPSGR